MTDVNINAEYIFKAWSYTRLDYINITVQASNHTQAIEKAVGLSGIPDITAGNLAEIKELI